MFIVLFIVLPVIIVVAWAITRDTIPNEPLQNVEDADVFETFEVPHEDIILIANQPRPDTQAFIISLSFH